MTNPYEILGVQPGADEKAIKSAFKKLAKKYHPDVNRDDEQAEKKFKEINEAYSVLCKPRGPSSSGNNPHVNPADMFGEAQTIFDAIFRGGTNVLNRVPVDPELLIRGGQFQYTMQTLERVNGRIQPVSRAHTVTVEADTPAMAQIAIPGAARFSFIQLVPVDTERYRVSDGIHLTETKEISVFTAMAGGEIEVTTPSGKNIKIKLPAGVQPNSTQRVRAMGLRAPNGMRGDYNVQFSIRIPAITPTVDQKFDDALLAELNKENV